MKIPSFSGLLLIITLMICFSCQQQEAKLDEEGIWRLGWRMIENSWDENYDQAELQFDSLLATKKQLDEKFLSTGLMIKKQLSKEEEILQVLTNQPKEILAKICPGDFISSLEPCQGIPEEEVEDKALQLEIIKLFVDDQAVRGNLMKDLLIKFNLDSTSVTQENSIEVVDKKNRNALKEILKTHGFPNRQMIGKEAMNGAFFIIQHADRDKEWQESQFPNIEKAVENGDLPGQKYAYLYDRIKINDDQPQRYGTQFSNVDPINKTVELAPTEDVETLDRRRRAMGMMPIETYKNLMLNNL